jgi:hypothetical protein
MTEAESIRLVWFIAIASESKTFDRSPFRLYFRLLRLIFRRRRRSVRHYRRSLLSLLLRACVPIRLVIFGPAFLLPTDGGHLAGSGRRQIPIKLLVFCAEIAGGFT